MTNTTSTRVPALQKVGDGLRPASADANRDLLVQLGRLADDRHLLSRSKILRIEKNKILPIFLGEKAGIRWLADGKKIVSGACLRKKIPMNDAHGGNGRNYCKQKITKKITKNDVTNNKKF